jgi:O-glycosyl hydrolase
MDQVKQTMQGIGVSNAFFTNWWHNGHPYSSEIYGLFLGELQPSMLRIRNNFGINADADMKIDAEFLAIAKKQLGYDPIVLMTGWSPPAWLKVSKQLLGSATNSQTRDVLAKDELGRFRYYDFAQYWVKSLQAYAAMGVVPDFFRYVLLEQPFIPCCRSCMVQTNGPI